MKRRCCILLKSFKKLCFTRKSIFAWIFQTGLSFHKSFCVKTQTYSEFILKTQLITIANNEVLFFVNPIIIRKFCMKQWNEKTSRLCHILNSTCSVWPNNWKIYQYITWETCSFIELIWTRLRMEHCHIDYYTCSNSMFITEIFEDMATVLQVQLF